MGVLTRVEEIAPNTEFGAGGSYETVPATAGEIVMASSVEMPLREEEPVPNTELGASSPHEEVPTTAGGVALAGIAEGALVTDAIRPFGMDEPINGPPSSGVPVTVVQPELEELDKHLDEMYGDE